MLIKPTLESLMKRVDSKYTLVTLAAKRARQLTDGDKPLVDVDTTKVVSIAMEEIDQGKITYEAPKAGIK
ncbi:DNA-directed RNA polymerase subunit omega [Megasphaera hexanoica]|jgi:DNA-directed RNA polymerase subunit omega|uniref:DNA-directed RNA polymerase subunit omega n=1 Tax=Megasphaera hexanoica TaxID=1675036 RepID=A0A848BSS2_9FIRM|nr:MULTISPECIES: DNA-directed RNA polymerase subunit omega [Megasphaera]MCI5532949.1 DNA-directed RNA polymerase subunit omega [Caecibacter massiliensis]AXB82021.1 DNA-directed RNA polymerase subunit omega [Megasphaera hexanoica]KUH57383.1 DNA-directed RNA polymerase subunit omega [Megasphaera sp. DJF_B143]MDY2903490.1 DNA-directed RNA polymerase subunit omega [Caecibacter massiliensis]NME28220.1 DNA-directed RNA polymerase subunit omega [Megasphaera hexanoica]